MISLEVFSRRSLGSLLEGILVTRLTGQMLGMPTLQFTSFLLTPLGHSDSGMILKHFLGYTIYIEITNSRLAVPALSESLATILQSNFSVSANVLITHRVETQQLSGNPNDVW